MREPTGELAILNVAGGDVKITFDKHNEAEKIRARRIITPPKPRSAVDGERWT